MAKTLRTSGTYTLETSGSNDILLKPGGDLGIGSVSSPDTSVHVKTSAAQITLQRTDDANKPGLIFQQSGGNIRAKILMDGTSGTSKELIFQTHDSSLAERFRVTHSGAKVSGTLNVDDGVTITDNAIKASASNADLELDGSGSGVVKILDNAEVVGTLTTANITNTNNITTTQLDADGVRLKDNTITTSASNADLEINASGSGTVVLENLKVGSGATVTTILDEDNMSSDSATALATQQSIKAYVDAEVTAQDLDFATDDSTALSIDLDSETLQFSGGPNITTSGSGNTVTISLDTALSNLTSVQVDGITITDNKVSTNASNSVLQLASSGSGDVEIDSGGDIILDADNADVILKDDGTEFGRFSRVASDLVIKSATNNKDILFKGVDDSATITALQLDMSEGGNAIFSGNVTATDITANSLTTNVISSNGSNANISIQASGTGSVEIGALDIKGTSISSADSTLVNINESVNVTGTLTSRGNVFGVQRLTGSGSTEVINLTDTVTLLITTGSSQQFSLADGVEGQLKIISMVTDGGTGVVTPANFVNGTNITFDDVEDTVTLLYQSTGWVALARQNATFG
jgi:hypothetical protein